MRWIKDRLKQCDCCGSPVPECYAVCFVCLSDRRGKRIAELKEQCNFHIAQEKKGDDLLLKRIAALEAENILLKEQVEWYEQRCEG